MVLVLLGGCCFAGGGPRAPVAPAPSAAPVPAAPPVSQQEATAAYVAQVEETARAQVLTPEQRLAEIERVVSTHDTMLQSRSSARGHLDALPDGFEPARVRAARRGLDRIDREVYDGFLRNARVDLREGRLRDAESKLAMIPDGVSQARARDQLRRQVVQATEREARAAAIRGPTPRTSAWDGRAVCIDSYFAVAAHDPDSIDIVTCGGVMIRGNEYFQDCVYRGRNAFGATTVSSTRFFIQHEQVIRTQNL